MSIFDYKNNFKDIEDVPCELIWDAPNCPTKPEVSIIMPVYKNHDYFPRALRSALQQDWNGSYEVTVVDNDTSENNPNQKIIEEINDPRVRYFRNTRNIGVTGNWNRGIIKARAPYVTFLHDDDMFTSEALSVGMKVAAKYPGKLVIAALKPIDKDDKSWVDDSEYERARKLLFFRQREEAKVSFARSLCLNMGNCEGDVLSREKLIAIGGFNDQSYPVLDYELLVRYTYHFGAVYLRHPTVLYRFASNDSYNVYSDIAPTQRKVAEDMIKHIHLPHWIMRRVADTYCKNVDNNYRRSFAIPEHQVNHKISTLDRFLLRFYSGMLNFLEAYSIDRK